MANTRQQSRAANEAGSDSSGPKYRRVVVKAGTGVLTDNGGLAVSGDATVRVNNVAPSTPMFERHLVVAENGAAPLPTFLHYCQSYEIAQLKRDAQNKRAMYYIDKVDAGHVFPMAGPPMFLREELFRYNGTGLENDSIFTDQAEFLEHLRADVG